MGDGLKELQISTRKQINSFPVKGTIYCAVTRDNKFLIAVGNGKKSNLTKWSVRSKKLLHTWQSGINRCVCS